MNKKHWEQVDKENEYIMKRMHPAVMIPGFFIGFMVLIGCIFKFVASTCIFSFNDFDINDDT